MKHLPYGTSLHESDAHPYAGTDENLGAANTDGLSNQGQRDDEGNSEYPTYPGGANPQNKEPTATHIALTHSRSIHWSNKLGVPPRSFVQPTRSFSRLLQPALLRFLISLADCCVNLLPYFYFCKYIFVSNSHRSFIFSSFTSN
ncbi:MAG: hypothetical protein ACREOI_08730 [bacterium]